ncbi:MAG: response regulator transcription factor [Chloroflexi bacterium]|jgi:DNA-binding NarL/FixJ family response regulator|nr:response regulator transcription factor [Chloroflexota bacterium]
MDATTMGELLNFFQNESTAEFKSISVLLVDDQPVFRNVAKSVLERDGACEVIGEATDGMHALEMMSKLNPDIVVMDVQMGDMSGVEATRRILSRHPQANVVLTSMGSDSEYPTLAREIGARGFVPKRNLNVSMLRSLVGGGPSGGNDAIAA